MNQGSRQITAKQLSWETGLSGGSRARPSQFILTSRCCTWRKMYTLYNIYIYTKTVYGFKSLKRIWDLETAASATTADYDCGDIITVIIVIIINASLRNKPQVPQDRKCRSHVQTDNLLFSQLGYFPMGNSGRCLQGRPVTGNPYDKKYSDKMP